ncbi:MAG: SciE type virulence protein [Planctomycetes bacterium]|nr:SciE type virulence protein [Planctomycetota bacterium]
MDANQLYKAGKLAEAIDAQIAVVKAKPIDQGARLFLFELFAFSGDLDRAQKQIDAMQADQPEIATALLDYRKILAAERSRREVFGNKVQPEFLMEPPEHVRDRLLGLLKLADNAPAEAQAAFAKANDALPELKGTLDGKPFDSLRDGDDCLGSVLEVFSQGRYFWVPFEQIQMLTMNAPRFPRDLLWIPAHLEMRQGDAGSVFLPALYPGTEKETDTQLKLGRLTDWRGDSPVRGVGVKIFFVGDEEMSLLDWRKLEFPA